MKKVFFVNTFHPVVPLYRDTFPLLEEKGIVPVALISSGIYRNTDSKPGDIRLKHVWMPEIFKRNKRLCAIFYALVCPFYLLRVPKNSIIIFLSQPPLFFIFGALIARMKRVKYCLHVMDLYPDLLLANRGQRKRFFYRILEAGANFAFQHAERVIVLGRCMEHIIRIKRVDSDKIHVVQNWASTSCTSIAPEKKNFRRKYALQDKFVVMYAGNMGRFHIFQTLLGAARALQYRRDFAFIFIGNGDRRAEIQREIDQGACNVMLLDHLPDEEFSESLSSADMHYISLRDEASGLIVPSKFYASLAAGKPVIYEGPAKSEVSRTIEENDCGKVIRPFDTGSLVNVLESYSNERHKAIRQGENARTAYCEKYAMNILANRYAELLRNI